MAIYGLFVGINQYEAGERYTLYGCENDVSRISEVLTTRYAIPPENCRTLINENAGKRNIIAGFKEHLAQAGNGDTAVFYFSGHGSQETIDPRLYCIEPDGLNETLVCHDSRASEPYDLADKELRYLIHQIGQRGAKVVTIIDSCHSGNATRDLDDVALLGVRQSPGSKTPRPLESYTFFNDSAARGWFQDFTRMPEGEHIALSACRSDQLSKEIYIRRTKHGAFTYAFCQALEYILVPPSYRNLLDAASQKIKSVTTLQNPQLDSVGSLDIHAAFLGSDIQPVVYQVDFSNGEWWLNAGLPQGINANARLQVDNKGGETRVKVVEALHNQSRLVVEDGNSLDTHLRYSARMLDPAIPKLPVAFEGDAALVQALRQTLGQSDARYYLEESSTPAYLLDTSTQAIVLARGEQSSRAVYVPDPQTGKKHGIPLPLAVDLVTAETDTLSREQIALQLAVHMAKWQRTMDIAYTVGAIPKNLVEVVIEQYDHATQQYSKLDCIDDGFDLHYQQMPNGEVLAPRFKLSLELNMQIPWLEDVYVSLLYLDPVTGSITLMTANKGEIFRQQEKTIDDGPARVVQPKCIHYQYKKRGGSPEINASIPDNLLTTGINQTTDYLKLFVSNFELDVSNLAQPSLKKFLQSFYTSQRSADLDEYEPIYKAITRTISLFNTWPSQSSPENNFDKASDER